MLVVSWLMAEDLEEVLCRRLVLESPERNGCLKLDMVAVMEQVQIELVNDIRLPQLVAAVIHLSQRLCRLCDNHGITVAKQSLQGSRRLAVLLADLSQSPGRTSYKSAPLCCRRSIPGRRSR